MYIYFFSWCGALPCKVSGQFGPKLVGLWRVKYIFALFSSFIHLCTVSPDLNTALVLPTRQDTFMENYFTSQRDNIFRNVEVLIYVFDVESRELEKDMHYYQSCLEAILQNSPDAKVFCLVHKMDLVQEDQRDVVSLTYYPCFCLLSHCWLPYMENTGHKTWCTLSFKMPLFCHLNLIIIKSFYSMR